MKYIQIARLVVSLLPVLIQAIKAAEEALPGRGRSEAKLAMVRGILESAYAISTDAIGSFDQVWPAINGAITVLVQSFRKTGIFNK